MSFVDGWRQDIKGAVRGLTKNPGFAAAALVTLTLGIGATAAVFSVVQAALLTPLPYDDPDRRVLIWSRWVSFNKTWLSDQEIVDYRNFSQALMAIAGWSTGQQNLTGNGEPMRVGVGFLTANTFDVLGVHPILGRTFSEAEDRPNGPPAAILGYPLWQTLYAGDASVVGRKVLVNDVSVEIVGVMPDGFRLPTDFTVDAAEPTQLWRPLQLNMQNLQRGSHSYHGAALLAPGHTAATATQELRAITQRLTERGDYPKEMQFSAFAVGLDEDIRGEVRPALWLLMGAVGFLLLIACVNVANLLLVRGEARVREMAVRTAIGAAPSRLMRQLFTESLVLAIAGAGLGLALAAGALRLLIGVDPTSLPPLAPVRLDLTVLVFTLVLGIVTTLLFGLVPARHALRVNLVESLRDGGPQATVGSGRHRLSGMLVAAQVALAVVLMIGAGLMIRSLGALGRIDLGFNPERVLTMRLALPPARYDTPEKVVNFYRQLVERVRAVPAVEQAGVMRVLPLATTIGDFGLDVEGFEEAPGRNAKGDWQIVSDGTFESMGTRLVRGRWFSRTDTSEAQLIAVINETMARAYWKDGTALGGRIRIGNPRNPWVIVVGIVADERHNGVTGIVKEKFYIPHSQWHIATGGNLIRGVFLVARTSGDPMTLVSPIRNEIRQLDPNLPVANIRPMTTVVSTALATSRLTAFVLSVLAGIALALAAVGVYGVMAYSVAQRTHEIGIRLAMGADRRQVLGMVLKRGVALSALGLSIGVPSAFVLTRLMQTLLYQVTPTDPTTFVTVPLALIAVSVIASYVPAFRATRVSPTTALRMD